MKDICKIINRNINRGKVTRICSSNLKLLFANSKVISDMKFVALRYVYTGDFSHSDAF